MKNILASAVIVFIIFGCGKTEKNPENRQPVKKPVPKAENSLQEEKPATPPAEKPDPEAKPLLLQSSGISESAAQKPAEPEVYPATVEDVSDPSGWRHAGWGGGGFFWCASFDPSDGNTIYLGGDVGGLYKSEDKGLNFRFINKGLGDYAVYSMAVSQSSPKVLYVLTNSGVCRSEDGGENWIYLEKTDKNGLAIQSHRPKSVRAIAVDPRDCRTVYAGSRTGRLFKSTDGGGTWKQLDFLAGAAADSPQAAFSGKGCLSMKFESNGGSWENAGKIQRVYTDGSDLSGFLNLSAMIKVPADALKLEVQLVVQTGEKWLWQSSPFTQPVKGQWTEINFDLADVKEMNNVRAMYVIVRSPEAGFKGEVLVDALTLRGREKEKVIADWENPGNSEGWKANPDTGKYSLVKEVRQIGEGAAAAPEGVLSSICISPADPEIILITSTAHGLLRSSDGGETWDNLDAPDNASNAVFSKDGQTAYAAFWDKGVQKSSDAGRTWRNASAGIDAGHSVREIVIHPENPGIAYAIAEKGWNGKVFKTADGASSWSALTRSVSVTEQSGDPTGDGQNAELSRLTNIALNPADPEEIFMSANWRNIFSSDGGKTWEERSKGADITCFQDIQFLGTDVYAVAMDEGLFSSSDSGRTWKQLHPLKYTAGLSGHQWRVRVIKKGDQTKIVSTLYPWENTGGPYKILISEDSGKTITPVITGLPAKITRKDTMWGSGYPRALAVHPANPDILYLGIDGEPEPDKGIEGGGVFRSDDGGYTWKRLSNQPDSLRMFFGLDIDPTDPKRLYWAACGDRGGIYMSEDEGNSWEKAFKGETWFFNLAVTNKGVVYAGANNLYRSADKGKTWEKIGDFKDNWSVVGIVFDPDNENRMWVSQVPWGDRAQGAIYMTEDGCRTWKDISGDIPYKKPMILRYNRETKELWAGGVGVYKLKQ